MATAVATPVETLADLVGRLGDIPLDRIRANPSPGSATEADALRLAEAADKHLCELIDGVLVEKAMGLLEARLAVILVRMIDSYAEAHALGIVIGADGLIRLGPKQVRIPDVGFYSTDRIPGGCVPTDPLPTISPNLAVEILSPSNTKKEMERKRADYFAADVELIWEIDPRKQLATVWTSIDSFVELMPDDSLDGGHVLPGFSVRLGDLFDRLKHNLGKAPRRKP